MEEESVIVSGTKTGEICAFHNFCRHRGTQMCQETSGKAKYFACSFHGWACDLEGDLKVAPMMPDDFAKDQFPLKPVWLKEGEGMIFLHLSHDEPEATVRGPLSSPYISAHQLSKTKVIADHTYEVQTNWKITGRTLNK